MERKGQLNFYIYQPNYVPEKEILNIMGNFTPDKGLNYPIHICEISNRGECNSSEHLMKKVRDNYHIETSDVLETNKEEYPVFSIMIVPYSILRHFYYPEQTWNDWFCRKKPEKTVKFTNHEFEKLRKVCGDIGEVSLRYPHVIISEFVGKNDRELERRLGMYGFPDNSSYFLDINHEKILDFDSLANTIKCSINTPRKFFPPLLPKMM